jgi:hypothetical protein
MELVTRELRITCYFFSRDGEIILNQQLCGSVIGQIKNNLRFCDLDL